MHAWYQISFPSITLIGPNGNWNQKCFPILFSIPLRTQNVAGTPSTRKAKVAKPATDAAETQPVDVMGLVPPDSLPPTSSPDVSTKQLRQKYQRTAPADVPSTASFAKHAAWAKFHKMGFEHVWSIEIPGFKAGLWHTFFSATTMPSKPTWNKSNSDNIQSLVFQPLCPKEQNVHDYSHAWIIQVHAKAKPAQDDKTDEGHVEKKVSQVKKSVDEDGKGKSTAVNGHANDDDIAPVTRDQQLRLKNATKGSRTKGNTGGKVSPKKRSKCSKRNAPKKNLSKRSKRNAKRKKRSAKRKMLEKATEPDVEPAQKKRRSSGSKDGKKKKTDSQDTSACPDPSGQSPEDEKMPKAKAKCKASAKSKAKRAPKAKCAPKAKAKCAPKRKAAPKAESKAKGKGRGKSKKGPGDDFLAIQTQSNLFNAEMAKELEEFAKSFDTTMVVTSPAFKQVARSHVPKYESVRLNIYWTRTSVGVTSLETQKDVATFSFNTSSACDVHKIGVALNCGMRAAT